MGFLTKMFKKVFKHMSRDESENVESGRCVFTYQSSISLLKYPVSVEKITCEELCYEIGQHLGISPALLYCFSLAVVDNNGTILWLPWTDDVDFNDLNSQGLHFRMRILPYRDKCSELINLDHNCLKYLYWQLNNDFRHGRLHFYNNNDKEALGVVLISIFVEMRIETELRDNSRGENLTESVELFMKNGDYKLQKFLPRCLKKDWLAKWNIFFFFFFHLIVKGSINSSLKTKLLDYQKKYPYPTYKSDSVILSQVHVILTSSHSYYYFEKYDAWSLTLTENGSISKEAEVEIVIEMACQYPSVKLMQKSTETKQEPPLKCKISDITELQIEEVTIEGTCWWKVSFIWYLGPPKVVYFKQRSVAKSCVSCIEAYHRLIVDFYDSLYRDMRPMICQTHSTLRAYGPVSDNVAEQKLQRNQNSTVYMLRMNSKKYSEFEILFWKNATVTTQSLGKIVKTDDEKFTVEGSDQEPAETQVLLLQQVILSLDVLPANSSRLKPRTEGCDILQKLLQEKDPDNIINEKEEERRRKQVDIQPKVFLPSAVQNHSTLGQGHFTTVSESLLNDTDQVVVKQLRDLDLHDVRIYKELEKCFNESFNQHLHMYEPSFFVSVLGIQTTSPLGLVMKRAQHGSLSHLLRFQDPTCDPLTLNHLVSVVLQLGATLMYMEEKSLTHGNIHCDNILVFCFSRSEITVRLSDPGMVHIYNKLPLHTEINKKRLPWLAPEQHETLSKVTIATEVFACGTTMWQMFAGGLSPLEADPELRHKSYEQLCSYFKNEEIRLSVPDFLQPQPSDSPIIKNVKERLYDCMCSCWKNDAQERLNPAIFQKTVNNEIIPYGDCYHDYNIIPGDESSKYPVNGSGLSAIDVSMATERERGAVCLNSNITLMDDLRTIFLQEERQVPAWQPMVPSAAGAAAAPLRVSINHRQVESGRVARQGQSHVVSAGATSPIVVSDVKFLIAESRLHVDRNERLGGGYYGAIYKGLLTIDRRKVPVAVKVLKDTMVERFADTFLKEAAVMEKLEHANIVKFYGIYRGEQVVMELVERNSLLHFLVDSRKKSQPVTKRRILNFALDITKGMEYLSEMKVVHCDLAARNILLAMDFTAKISDFGLSRLLKEDKDYYRRAPDSKEPLPLLWCAPEWIAYRRFLEKSDVWSFGVVLWEIASCGKDPNILKNRDKGKIYDILEKGERLEKPSECPQDVYDLMLTCWAFNYDNRPNFSGCKNRISLMLEEHSQEKGKNIVTSKENVNVLTQNGTGLANDATTAATDVASASPAERLNTDTELESPAPVVTNDTNDSSRETTPSNLAHGGSLPTSLRQGSDPVPKNQLNGVQNIGQSQSPVDWKIIQKKDVQVEERKLGEGAFGCVYGAVYKEKKVAIKECTKDTMYDRFQREFEVLAKMQHPNIVQFIGLIKKDEQLKHYKYVMEYMSNGNLNSHLRKCYENKQVETPGRKAGYLLDIAKAMHYLENKNIIHGDLTSANILLDSNLTAKIADFGFTKEMKDGQSVYMRGDGTMFKHLWAAPEVFTGKLTTESDVWSFGNMGMDIFLDGQFTKKYNFEKERYDEWSRKIEAGQFYKRPETCPRRVYDTFLACWKVVPTKRMRFVLIEAALSEICQNLPQ